MFDKAKVWRSCFLECDLSHTSLGCADLSGATFHNTDLECAVLLGANLTGIQFDNTNLERVLWNTNFPTPEGWQLVDESYLSKKT